MTIGLFRRKNNSNACKEIIIPAGLSCFIVYIKAQDFPYQAFHSIQYLSDSKLFQSIAIIVETL